MIIISFMAGDHQQNIDKQISSDTVLRWIPDSFHATELQ